MHADDIDVFVGIDVGKADHWATALSRDGASLFDKALGQSPRDSAGTDHQSPIARCRRACPLSGCGMAPAADISGLARGTDGSLLGQLDSLRCQAGGPGVTVTLLARRSSPVLRASPGPFATHLVL